MDQLQDTGGSSGGAPETVGETLARVMAEHGAGEAPAEPQHEPTAEPAAAGDEGLTAAGRSSRHLDETLKRSEREVRARADDRAALDEVFKPYTEKMAAAGFNRAEITRAAIEGLQQITSDPGRTLLNLVKHLDAHATPEQRQALLRELGVDQAATTATPQQQLQAEISRAESTIADFAASRPNFPQVRQVCGQLIQEAHRRGARLSLQRAYELSCTAARLPVQGASPARQTSAAQAKAASTPRQASGTSAPAAKEDLSIDAILKRLVAA
jgi:hypothetical protein